MVKTEDYYVAKLARRKGHKALAKMSKIIAGDEMRHHLAYSHFVEEIFRKKLYNKVFNFANETFVRDNNYIFYSINHSKIFFNISRVIEEGELNFWFCQPLSSEI